VVPVVAVAPETTVSKPPAELVAEISFATPADSAEVPQLSRFE
jgi:hypothetical protein